MKREQLEKILSRAAPALLAGAIALVMAWGGGKLWGAILPRSMWLVAGGCWAVVFGTSSAWRSKLTILVAHGVAAALFASMVTATKIAWPATLPKGWLMVLTALALLIARWLVGRVGDKNAGAEAARLLLIGVAAWWACRP